MAALGVAEGPREIELLGLRARVCGGVAIGVATVSMAENLGKVLELASLVRKGGRGGRGGKTSGFA